jgi:mannose-1-phosphate guanylyltransferase
MTNTDKAYAVLMAGGSGTRFWPLSRSTRPKQLLALGPDRRSLLRATAERVWGMLPAERTFVVTSAQLREQVEKELPEIPPHQILAEPVGRNTAPCVGWAATHVKRLDEDAIMAVLPADHYIGETRAYLDTLQRGLEAATHGDYVTIGIRPTRAETGYGYIEVGSELDPGVFRARRFVEKPNRQRAEQFVASGNFLWNSGMFFFRADVMLGELERQLPDLAKFAAACESLLRAGQSDVEHARAHYAQLTSISIDHGVMEKAADVRVVQGAFGWHDIGSWTTAYELSGKDALGNATHGATASLVEAESCYVRGREGKVIALIGVRDLVVVDTEDALLIMPRERAQDVRRVVEDLKSKHPKKFV